MTADADRLVRARGRYADDVCRVAWDQTDAMRRNTVRLLVNEPPPAERGAAQDLDAVVASPLPAPFCEWTPPR